MDIEQVFATGGAGGITVAVLFILYKFFHNRHIRSKCCGREIDIDTDVHTPKKDSGIVEYENRSYSRKEDRGGERLSGGIVSENQGGIHRQDRGNGEEKGEDCCSTRNNSTTEDFSVKSVP